MKKLEFKSTEYTPNVSFDPQSGQFEISGRSLPEDAGEFYDPLQDWLDGYLSSPANQTEMVINFEYFNSSSARRITELLFSLESLHEAGKDVKVIWYYLKNDLLIKENGEEIQSVVELPFEVKEIG